MCISITDLITEAFYLKRLFIYQYFTFGNIQNAIRLKKFTCDVLAVIVYWPLSRFAGLLHKMGLHKLVKKSPWSPTIINHSKICVTIDWTDLVLLWNNVF
jgi:hypothetical protein